MAAMALPSAQLVRKLIDYNPVTGRMFWRPRPRSLFNSDRAWKWWNTRYAGQETATANGPDGYKMVKLFDKQFAAHRVAWVIAHGAWPQIIDHKNGRPSDNRLRNLRSVSRKGNQRNQRRHSSNTSGVTGVSWNRHTNKWVAQIKIDGKSIYLGSYEEISQATEARGEANRRYGFFSGHGRSP